MVATCRSDSDESDSEDEERKKKPIPKWARGQALAQALASQTAVDPDEIFKLHQKTCPLNEVFSHPTGDTCLPPYPSSFQCHFLRHILYPQGESTMWLWPLSKNGYLCIAAIADLALFIFFAAPSVIFTAWMMSWVKFLGANTRAVPLQNQPRRI